MKIYTLLSILFYSLFSVAVQAQIDTTYSQAAPVGGINRLALVYYDIDFTKEQRELLKDVDIELIFSVSDEGVALLESINGLNNRAIKDSLFAQTPYLPMFIPEMRGGISKQSLYFMLFQYPSYRRVPQELNFYSAFYQRKVEKNQFSELSESGTGVEFVLGGIFTNHFGSADKYLKPGGGVNMGVEYVAANSYYYGLGWEMMGNRAAQQMTAKDTLQYLKAPFTVAVGLYVGHRFEKFSIQLEAYYASISITSGMEEESYGGTNYEGFSPGLFVNYPLYINAANERVVINGGRAYINRFAINFRGGFRGMFMNNDQASGVLLELGAGIRFGSFFINRYRLKDSFYLD